MEYIEVWLNMIYKIREDIRHVIIWIVICFISGIFAERYASYLNIGTGLAIGIICISITIKAAGKYDISQKAKQMIDAIVIYSIGACIILLAELYFVQNYFIKNISSLEIWSIIYSLELIVICAYMLLRKAMLKNVCNNKVEFIKMMIIVTYCIFYTKVLIHKSRLLTIMLIVMTIMLNMNIWKNYIRKVYVQNDYFKHIVIARAVESIYVLTSDIDNNIFIFWFLFRMIGIYYLIRYMVYNKEEKDISKYNESIKVIDSKVDKQDKESNASYIIANLSHELKTPINVIRSAVEIMDLNKASNEKIITEIDTIKKECSMIMDMVQLIVDIEKVHDIKETIQCKRYNIVQVVENVTDAFNYEYGIGKIIFDTCEEEVYVYVNKNIIQQAIMAILHTIICNQVYSEIQINIESKQEEVEILISDGGIQYIEEIVIKIYNKGFLDYEKDNMIHILSVQLLIESINAYKGIVKFDNRENNRVMLIILPTVKTDNDKISSVGEWNVTELRENIRLKYL